MLTREDLDKLPMDMLLRFQVTAVTTIQDLDSYSVVKDRDDLADYMERRSKLADYLDLLNHAIHEPRTRTERVLLDDVTEPWG